MEWSDLALAALIISVIVLIVNVIFAVLARPHLSVSMRKAVLIQGGQEPAYAFRVNVINTGGAATTIADVGLVSAEGVPYASIDRLLSRSFLGEAVFGVVFDGPEPPCRVEAHGSLSWDFLNEATGSVLPGEKIWGFATRYRPVRWWHWEARRRSPNQLVKSRLGEVKGGQVTPG